MSTLNVEHLKHENSSSNNVTLDSDGSVAINRHTSDGTIIDLQKAGTSVGTIGTSTSYTNQLEIKSSSSNLILNANGSNYSFDAVQFYPLTSGRSLGLASNPFNNLYLSGGVYLGGTGAANLLDDYEEGTWTPSNGNLTSASGRYIKIGSMVTIWAELVFNSSASGSTQISGLPFGVIDGTWSGHIAITNIGRDDVRFFVHNSQTNAFFRSSNNNDFDASAFANDFIYASATYKTS